MASGHKCYPSWPGLTRPSGEARAAIDGRVKPGHDVERTAMTGRNLIPLV
jgi:hypothetical protein